MLVCDRLEGDFCCARVVLCLVGVGDIQCVSLLCNACCVVRCRFHIAPQMRLCACALLLSLYRLSEFGGKHLSGSHCMSKRGSIVDAVVLTCVDSACDRLRVACCLN